jgi:hypothetical protein
MFAFVSIRVFSNPDSVDAWKKTLKEHEQILQLIRMGDPFVAEQCVVRSMGRFASAGRSVWVNHRP